MSLITAKGSRSVAETFDLSPIDLAGVSGEVIIYRCMWASWHCTQSIHGILLLCQGDVKHTYLRNTRLLRPTLVPSSMWQGLAHNRECCPESNQLRSATQGALRECELFQSRLTVHIFSGSSSCTISGIMSLAYASTKATHWSREWKEVRGEGEGG